jgi:hypothetical protein
MEDLQFARGSRQHAAEKTGGVERHGRHPLAAPPDTTESRHQPEDRVQAGRNERNSAPSGRRGHQGPRRYRQVVQRVADPIVVTLVAGLVAEAVVPWAVIWLSDALVFDIPAWSLWLIFGVPAALTFLAMLLQGVTRARRRQAPRAAIPMRQA